MRPDRPEFLFHVRQRRRVSTALLLSLLIHALLLSLSLGGQGFGVPGLDMPWRERRLGADDLRVRLAPALPSPAALPAPAMFEPSAARPLLAAEAANEGPAAAAAAAPPVLASETPTPVVMSMARADAAAWALPPAPVLAAPVIIAAPSASSPESLLPAPSDSLLRQQIDLAAQARAEELAQERIKLAAEQQELARQEAARRELARLEAAKLEAAKQEAAKQEVVKQEAVKQEVAKQASIRLAAAAQELERAEAARQAALAASAQQQEVARQAAARSELERVERARLAAAQQAVARQEAARQEAAQQAAAQQEATRQEAARQESARQVAASSAKLALAAERAEQEAKREAAKRAIGRQLDEEAAKREAVARQSSPALLPGASTARRGRLFGRTDPNAELLLYAELWSRKIELNQTFASIREAAKQPHTQPLVTVAVRSDGSIESVTFVRSSGVVEIDEGIRRILKSQAPFPPFHPALAREFDVIEIRRSWSFDTAIRLY